MSETTSRVLQLLGLLQARRVWTGQELADRLGVTGRSVRRDIERLRDLGYPVHASKGRDGGYQPVPAPRCRRCCSTPRRPSRWRFVCAWRPAAVSRVSASRPCGHCPVRPGHARAAAWSWWCPRCTTTVTLTGGGAVEAVSPDDLMTLARACRDHEHVRLGYTDIRGNNTERRLEPYQLVTTGRRWYLLAYDRDKQDWRTLRLDRMVDVKAAGTTFAPRPAPDPAEFVRQAITASPYRYVARVRYEASESQLAQMFSASSAQIVADGPDRCVVTAGGDDPERIVLYLAMPGYRPRGPRTARGKHVN